MEGEREGEREEGKEEKTHRKEERAGGRSRMRKNVPDCNACREKKGLHFSVHLLNVAETGCECVSAMMSLLRALLNVC